MAASACEGVSVSDSATKALRSAERWGLLLPPHRPGCVWLHACSVGEVASSRPLIERLLAEGLQVHLTTITATGEAHSRRLFGARITRSFLPLDLPGAFERFVRALAPRACLVMETEFWPGMLRACARHGIPVLSVNTRISDRSYPRYRATRWFWRRALEPVRRFLAQSERDARRLVEIGASPDRVVITGNLKYAVDAPQVDAQALRAKLDPWGARTIWLAGSTHAGEEEALAQAFVQLKPKHRNLLLVVVPRHPERFDEAEEALARFGLRIRRWNDPASPEDDLVLVDAMGVLAGLYFACDLAFVGGSLVPVGGHNPLEAARAGRGVLAGPHLQNFREIYDEMQRKGAAIVVQNASELANAVDRLLRNREERAHLDAAARDIVTQKREIFARIWREVAPVCGLAVR